MFSRVRPSRSLNVSSTVSCDEQLEKAQREVPCLSRHEPVPQPKGQSASRSERLVTHPCPDCFFQVAASRSSSLGRSVGLVFLLVLPPSLLSSFVFPCWFPGHPVLNSKEHTQFRGGVGSLGWFVDHCCPQLSFQLAELRRKQASPTVQDLPKLNKVIRAAKVIESKIKIRSIPVEHLRFMGVHDSAHANLEGGASVISFLQYMQASRIVVCLCLY